MTTAPHPNVPSVHCRNLAPGVFQCVCQICGLAMPRPGTGRTADLFAHAHVAHPQQQPAPQYYGAGDLVAKATGALGIQPCTPCEQRKQALNGMFPRVLRRR